MVKYCICNLDKTGKMQWQISRSACIYTYSTAKLQLLKKATFILTYHWKGICRQFHSCFGTLHIVHEKWYFRRRKLSIASRLQFNRFLVCQGTSPVLASDPCNSTALVRVGPIVLCTWPCLIHFSADPSDCNLSQASSQNQPSHEATPTRATWRLPVTPWGNLICFNWCTKRQLATLFCSLFPSNRFLQNLFQISLHYIIPAPGRGCA